MLKYKYCFLFFFFQKTTLFSRNLFPFLQVLLCGWFAFLQNIFGKFYLLTFAPSSEWEYSPMYPHSWSLWSQFGSFVIGSTVFHIQHCCVALAVFLEQLCPANGTSCFLLHQAAQQWVSTARWYSWLSSNRNLQVTHQLSGKQWHRMKFHMVWEQGNLKFCHISSCSIHHFCIHQHIIQRNLSNYVLADNFQTSSHILKELLLRLLLWKGFRSISNQRVFNSFEIVTQVKVRFGNVTRLNAAGLTNITIRFFQKFKQKQPFLVNQRLIWLQG